VKLRKITKTIIISATILGMAIGGLFSQENALSSNTIVHAQTLEVSLVGERDIPLILDDFTFDIPYIAPGELVIIGIIELRPDVVFSNEFSAETNGNTLVMGISTSPYMRNFDVMIGDWLYLNAFNPDIQFTHYENITAYVYLGSYSMNQQSDNIYNITGRIYAVCGKAISTVRTEITPTLVSRSTDSLLAGWRNHYGQRPTIAFNDALRIAVEYAGLESNYTVGLAQQYAPFTATGDLRGFWPFIILYPSPNFEVQYNVSVDASTGEVVNFGLCTIYMPTGWSQ